MMRKIKNIILFVLVALVGFTISSKVSAQVAPSYYDNFAGYLTDESADSDGRIETVYNLQGISSEKTLQENIRCLFYPNAYNFCGSSTKGGLLWGVLRYIGLGLLILFITIIGVKLVVNGGDPAKVKESLTSLGYVIYGSLLFFGSTWILGTMLGVEQLTGTESLVNKIQGDSNSLGFRIVVFLKALAFFVAIIMIVVNGFKMMSNADKVDKAKAGIKGLLNVVVALAIIKIIDYVYYIALQPNFVGQATSLIVEIAKILGFIVGAILVLMTFYAGFLFITDQGKSENMKKAKNIIVGVVLAAFVIFMLLLIMYEIFAEFA